MRRIGDIHVFEDDAFLRFMRRASGFTVLAGIAAAVVWGLGMSALHRVLGAPVVPFELGAMFGAWGNGVLGVEGGQKFQLWWWILLVLVPLTSLGLHELVHAFFFSQFAPPGSRVTFGSNWEMGMIYASAEGIMYTRDQYLVIALAPSIVVSLLLMVLGMGLRWPLWTVIVVTVHLTGCSGDWGYVRAIRNDPAIAYCEDTSYGVAFYGIDHVISRPTLHTRAEGSAGARGVARADEAAGVAGAAGADGVEAGRCPASLSGDDRGFTVVEGGRRS